MGYKEILQRCSRTGNTTTKQPVYVFELKKIPGELHHVEHKKAGQYPLPFQQFFVMISFEWFQILKVSDTKQFLKLWKTSTLEYTS